MNSVIVQRPAEPSLGDLPAPQSPVAPAPGGAHVIPAQAKLSQPMSVRTSLRASTLEGLFISMFENVAGGVLLSNFLVDLGAGAIAIGMLTSIPLVANLLQPLGASLSERTTSRKQYCLWAFGLAKVAWLVLLVGIVLADWGSLDQHYLVIWTLGILVISNLSLALGAASWVSWLAALVPQRLRGRHFSLRICAANLATLVTAPLAGLVVATWPGGTLEGFGVVLVLAMVAGGVSLGFQAVMTDVDPQAAQTELPALAGITSSHPEAPLDDPSAQSVSSPPLQVTAQTTGVWQDSNFVLLLVYFGLWMFASHLSIPFLNLYMLDNLAIDVQWVTLYTGLMSAAQLVMMIAWGKLADRIGNRPLLILVGIAAGIMPLLWLGADTGALSLWVGLPLLNLLRGGTMSAIELCVTNIQLEVAPIHQQARYFAIAAAVLGITGALGTTVGGFLAESTRLGGIPGLFVLSTGLRLVAIVPLCFVHEPRSQSLKQILPALLPPKRPHLQPASSYAKL